jgi:hypothetical protein
MLLFEAMGGSGKSMPTWEWLTRHATAARGDWAGRFWYSFYEKGAVMAGFCRQALAYMTMQPAVEFAQLRGPALADRLVAELEQRPWLLVLDGLERILVAHHRLDAAQLRDEEADTATDQIGQRDPGAGWQALGRPRGAAPCTRGVPEQKWFSRRFGSSAPTGLVPDRPRSVLKYLDKFCSGAGLRARLAALGGEGSMCRGRGRRGGPVDRRRGR